MADLIVNGGRPIAGTVRPSGNKNAVLPMLCASLLTEEPVFLTNVPEISDIGQILGYFTSKGSDVGWDKAAGTISLRHDYAKFRATEAGLPTGIRAAVLLLAPALARAGQVIFDTDAKGCALGVREIDPHIEILENFGGVISGRNPLRIALDGALRPADIWPDYASVTGTETFMMIAAACKGVSHLTNSASEPHVQALAGMLEKMGASMGGGGSSRLSITGAEKLDGGTFRVPDDHHEVATFLAIGGVTGGRIFVETDIGPQMTLILRQLDKLGIKTEVSATGVTVTGWTRQVTQPYTAEMLPKIEAAPWPYFPADLLPHTIGIAIGCEGDVLFWNKVYEGALGWTSELLKFGARVHLSDPHRLVVFGSNTLRPAVVEAPYIIRVVVALLIAAIQIDGQSRIRNADPIRRAYPMFAEKLVALGADVRWD